MADLEDITGWKEELLDWRAQGREKDWKNWIVNENSGRSGRMPVNLATQYVKLVLSDSEKVNAIKDLADFGEKYRGDYDKRNPPEDYPHHYGEKVGEFFEWFCWKVDFFPKSFTKWHLHRCIVEFSDRNFLLISDEEISKFILSSSSSNFT